jgi:hypothetical protein
LCKLPSAILWTWQNHVSWFCSIYFILVSSSPICCLIVMFLILCLHTTCVKKCFSAEMDYETQLWIEIWRLISIHYFWLKVLLHKSQAYGL